MIKFIETCKTPYSKLLEDQKEGIQYSTKYNTSDNKIGPTCTFEKILKSKPLKWCEWD